MLLLYSARILIISPSSMIGLWFFIPHTLWSLLGPCPRPVPPRQMHHRQRRDGERRDRGRGLLITRLTLRTPVNLSLPSHDTEVLDIFCVCVFLVYSLCIILEIICVELPRHSVCKRSNPITLCKPAFSVNHSQYQIGQLLPSEDHFHPKLKLTPLIRAYNSGLWLFSRIVNEKDLVEMQFTTKNWYGILIWLVFVFEIKFHVVDKNY